MPYFFSFRLRGNLTCIAYHKTQRKVQHCLHRFPTAIQISTRKNQDRLKVGLPGRLLLVPRLPLPRLLLLVPRLPLPRLKRDTRRDATRLFDDEWPRYPARCATRRARAPRFTEERLQGQETELTPIGIELNFPSFQQEFPRHGARLIRIFRPQWA